jgi:hypothetical protein
MGEAGRRKDAHHRIFDPVRPKMEKVKSFFLLLLTSAGAWALVEIALTVRAYREKTAPAVLATARNVEAITALLADCDHHPEACAAKTAAAIQSAAGSVKDAAAKIPATAAAIQETATKAKEAAATINTTIAAGAPHVQHTLEAAAQFASLLGDCDTAPKTCLQPRLAGAMRAVELAAGNSYKVTREVARVAPATADAARDTTQNAAVVSAAAAKHAEPIAQHVESATKDAATIAHRAANPITYVLGLAHGLLKKVFPFIP